MISEKCINVAEFRCEKKRDRGQTRRFIKIAMTVFFLTEHGTTDECEYELIDVFCMFSGMNKDINALRALIPRKDLNVNAMDSEERTPLHYACKV